MPQTEAKPRTLGLETPVAAMAGIGPKRAAALAARGISRVEDAILHLPSRYQDWRVRTLVPQLRPGAIAVVEGELAGLSERPMPGGRGRRLLSGWLKSEAGRVRVVWFNLPGYLRGRIANGERVLAYGRVSLAPDATLEIVHPELHRLDGASPPPIRPIYSLPDRVPQRLFAGVVTRALAALEGESGGALPDELRQSAKVPPLSDALRYLHNPPADADLDKLARGDSEAHAALALDEMFAFQLALCIERMRAARRAGIAFTGAGGTAAVGLTAEFMSRLRSAPVPIEPTASQRRAIEEIDADMARPGQMNRLLMGDVGSGKTIVAFRAALRAVECGWQAAMMAPTELLAEQHHATFQRLCAGIPARNALLTGKVTGAQRSAVTRALARGEIAIVFGTQALIQQQVRIARLGLAIIDEQHRFGVFDRARLKSLGPTADMLLMTATPIPRSLAMALFANLDVSILDEMPPGRTPVATTIHGEEELPTIYQVVRDEVRAGHRAYYIVPLIEGDDEDAPSVAATAQLLRDHHLKGLRIGAMHGRMRPAEKDRTMAEFRDGVLDVLVSTTVVEVGIDVPEATVIVVAAAERYGLAQLHQLRGRVGRGRAASRCCLVASAGADSSARLRLRVLAETADGAEVARADLAMRGPGDLLGARQAGALPLRFVRFIREQALIVRARTLAKEWLSRDPGLESPASRGARRALNAMMAAGFSLADVG